MDNKLNKSQIMMLSLLASLIIITLLSSSSLRPTYLYFVIINILIIALGADAGLLSASSNSPEGHKNPPEASTELSRVNVTTASPPPPPPASELKKKVEKVKKCPSTPSLFFIGGEETEHTDHDQAFGEGIYEEDEGEKEVIEGLSGQELFNKSEMFIGNFYKQLRMQREDSWKRIHGYH